MIPYEDIEAHYRANRQSYIKWLSFRAGSEEAAEDIIQEAYYRCLKYSAAYENDKPLNHWVSRIVTRSLIDYINAEKGRNEEELPEGDKLEDVHDAQYEDFKKNLMGEIMDLVKTKSLVQIEVLTMFFKLEYSANDIAKITEYSYAQCHKIISRFREELKQLYS